MTLDSAELTGQSAIQPYGGDLQVTQTTNPFPNDSQKFAGVGPDGLRVAVDNLAGSFDNIFGNLITREWADQGFRVVFDLDQPAPFTYHRGPDMNIGSVALHQEGQSQPVFFAFAQGDLTGTLAPGHYTFSADTLVRFWGAADVRGSGRANISNVELNVLVPEPAVLASLALGACLLCSAHAGPGRRQPA